MRVLIDYRAALRDRSGAGEFTHQLVCALLDRFRPDGCPTALEVSLFSSSWKDRFRPDPPTLRSLEGARRIDRRVPVSLLNFAWHRLEWPAAEHLTGARFDVTHSMHPLLLPARAAAQVVTIHDLHFLSHPERTRAEVRRDYPRLAGAHARRSDRVIVPSRFTAGEVARRLDVPADRISICAPGRPDWSPRTTPPSPGYVLFLGTLEPRKNVGTLLEAYARLLAAQASTAVQGHEMPNLVLAGSTTPDAAPWLDQIARPPLRGRVQHLGYVAPENRRAVYEGARVLVLPSHEEGFGLPVLEAMTVGVPVAASARGAIPEVLGDAGVLVDPDDSVGLAEAIRRLVTDTAFARQCAERGITRSADFTWASTAARTYEAYQSAVDRRLCASA